MELNGTPATLDQLKALALTNYGHFTSMLVEGDKVRGLSLHMQRLVNDCQHLFGAELDTEQVRDYVRNALTEGQRTVARVTVFDPDLDMGAIGSDAQPHVLVTTREAGHGHPEPWSLQVASYRRDEPAVKHVGLYGAMRHRRTAQHEGFNDVLFLNPDGTISEIATSNIGFIRDGQVIWPRSEMLPGVTMRLINQAFDEPVVTEPVTLGDLAHMDAAFATNAATGVRPIASIEDIEWDTDHKMIRGLREVYTDIPPEQV